MSMCIRHHHVPDVARCLDCNKSTAAPEILMHELSTCLQGPTYTFEVSGGYCYIVTETKAVTCVKPTVTLNMDPGVCSLKYTTPTTVFVSHSGLCLLLPCTMQADHITPACTQDQMLLLRSSTVAVSRKIDVPTLACPGKLCHACLLSCRAINCAIICAIKCAVTAARRLHLSLYCFCLLWTS